jgi:hypothetical protein
MIMVDYIGSKKIEKDAEKACAALHLCCIFRRNEN